MHQVTISDVPGFDGTYEWDQDRGWNGHELHLIKKVSGVRLGEIQEALDAGDYDVVVAAAAIAIWRSGRVAKDQVAELVDMLMEAEGGKILFGKADDEAGEAGDAAGPPAEAPSGPGSSGAGTVSLLRSSESSSSTGDDPPETSQASTGDPGSAANAG